MFKNWQNTEYVYLYRNTVKWESPAVWVHFELLKAHIVLLEVVIRSQRLKPSPNMSKDYVK